MPKITVVNRVGKESIINAQAGLSLMQALRDNGIDEILAICGGCCSCATCHIYIDPSFEAKVPAIAPEESELLDTPNRRPTSRLSCQVVVTDALEGLKLTVAPED